MANKNLFKSLTGRLIPATDAINEERAPAYALSPRAVGGDLRVGFRHASGTTGAVRCDWLYEHNFLRYCGRTADEGARLLKIMAEGTGLEPA